jgi:hypothetical protein
LDLGLFEISRFMELKPISSKIIKFPGKIHEFRRSLYDGGPRMAFEMGNAHRLSLIFFSHLLPFMKCLLALILLFPVSLLAQDLPRYRKPAATDDKRIFEITKHNGAGIGYQTHAQVADQIRMEAKLDSLSEAEVEARIKEIPAGGHLRMGLASYTRESVLLENFTIIVYDEKEKKIFNQLLKPSAPGKTAGIKPVWGNLGIVPLYNPPKTGYKIFIIDSYAKKSYEFLMKMD